MKSLAIYCVNYASYNDLYLFLNSIEKSAFVAKNELKVNVYIADNTETNIEEIKIKSDIISIRIFTFHKNIGYMGAIQQMMKITSPQIYNYVAISNVDLTLSENALKALSELKISSDIGWVAPRIFSKELNYDRNPSILSRYSKKHLLMLRFMFRHPWINYIYKKTLYKRKSIHRNYKTGIRIYAGHGSFMILTKEFFTRCNIPDYKMFLFCEELYLAEKCRMAGLYVTYEPSICIMDKEHVSVSKLHKPVYYHYNEEALTYIVNTFYK